MTSLKVNPHLKYLTIQTIRYVAKRDVSRLKRVPTLEDALTTVVWVSFIAILKSHYQIAFKCFMMDEEEFVDLLIDKFEEKKKYVAFLE